MPYQKIPPVYLVFLIAVMYSFGKPTSLKGVDLKINWNIKEKESVCVGGEGSKDQTIAVSGLFLLGYTVSHVWAIFVLNFLANNFLVKQPWQCPSNLFMAPCRDITMNLFASLSISGAYRFFTKSSVLNFRISITVRSYWLIDGPVSPVTLLTSCTYRSLVWVNKQVSEVGSMWLYSACRLLFHHMIIWSISGGQSSELKVA